MKNILKLYIWIALLLIIVAQLKAQNNSLSEIALSHNTQHEDRSDSIDSRVVFAKNLLFLNVGIQNGFLDIGINYERFLMEGLSLSAGIATPRFQPQMNVFYSIWAGNHRIYGGLNISAYIYGLSQRIYLGPKLGYQYQPRKGGFCIGFNIAQWFVEYNLLAKTRTVAPLWNPYSLIGPSIQINIGHVF